MIKLSKTSKTAMISIAMTVAVILVIIGTWFLSAFINRPIERQEAYSIREEIVPIAELATYEYNFTEVMYYTSVNADNPLRVEVPFSENKYIATIDGYATIFTDTEKIAWNPHYSLSNLLVAIDITLPHSQVKEPVALDFETLNELENRNGFLNEFTDEDFSNLLIQTNTNQLEKIKADGILEQADKRVMGLIEAQLKSIYGQELYVRFNFIDT